MKLDAQAAVIRCKIISVTMRDWRQLGQGCGGWSVDKVNQKRTVACRRTPNSLRAWRWRCLTCRLPLAAIRTRSTFYPRLYLLTTLSSLCYSSNPIEPCLQEPATSGLILLQFSRTTFSSSQPYSLLSVSSFLIPRSSLPLSPS
jgi:hypothetical protein